jgi:hypothetical protein
LRHIGGGQDFGAYGPQEDAVAGHIELFNRVPPIGRGLCCLHLFTLDLINDLQPNNSDAYILYQALAATD